MREGRGGTQKLSKGCLEGEGAANRDDVETTKRFTARNEQHLTQQKRTTCAIRETPYVTSDSDFQIFIVLHYLQNYNCITTFTKITKITSDKKVYITLNNQNKCA